MAKIAESYIERLRSVAAANIKEIIDRRVTLQKAGKNFSACCPFHEEKTPSFVVTPEKGAFNCFGGCGGGGALDFIMQYERVEFVEAISILSKELNLGPVEYLENPDEVKKDAQEIKQAIAMKSALVAASGIFTSELARDEPTLRYLLDRGVTPSDIAEFKIGVTPKASNAITTELLSRFSLDVLKGCYLVAEDDASHRKYDCFRNRLMFPIRNIKGDVVAFGGRRLDGGKERKYINSGNSSIFNKSKTLYGLYESITMPGPNLERGVFNFTEGYMDVIAAHRNGFTNTVAGLGTGITIDHIKMLFQRCDKIRFIQDGDAAGIKSMRDAIKVAAPLLTPTKVCTVVILPDGEDIDSLLKRNKGVAEFKELIANEIPMSQFIVDYLISKNSDTAEGHAKAAADVNEIIGLIQDSNLKMTMQATLHRALGISSDQNPNPPTPTESPDQLFAKLPQPMQQAINTVPPDHRSLAGLVLNEPEWKTLLKLDEAAIRSLPKSSAELINLCLGAGRSALTNANHPAHKLMKYLSAYAPQVTADQIKAVVNFNENIDSLRADVLFNPVCAEHYEEDFPDEYEEYSRSSNSMSN